IIKVAKEKKIPVFSPSPFEIMKGATAALYPDFQEGGVVAGKMIARILRGESPAKIPFYRLQTTKTQLADTSKGGAAKPQRGCRARTTAVLLSCASQPPGTASSAPDP